LRLLPVGYGIVWGGGQPPGKAHYPRQLRGVIKKGEKRHQKENNKDITTGAGNECISKSATESRGGGKNIKKVKRLVFCRGTGGESGNGWGRSACRIRMEGKGTSQARGS